jgi:hypothetical protein
MPRMRVHGILVSMLCSVLSGKASAVEQVFAITVVNANGNVFAIDAVNKPILNILRSGVYTFDQSDYSNVGHQIAFKDSTGTPYTTGVTTTGTAGTSGAQTVFTVDVDAPDNLLYYCVAHGNSMGNTILVASSTPPETTPPETTTTPTETTPPPPPPEVTTTHEETTPPPSTETTPPETTPQETTPSTETTPPDTTPPPSTETTPRETTTQETTPPPSTETTPPETTPQETTPPPPTETTPQETTPSETTPPETPPETSSPLETTQAPFTTPVPANFEPLTCVGCAAGFFLSRETLNCTQCPPGSGTHKYSNASSAEQCMCLPGFSNKVKSDTNTSDVNVFDTCVLCPAGTYKETLGNVSCTLCPANSTTPFSGETNATQCVCNTGFKENRTSSLMSSSVQPSTTNNRNWINLLSCNSTRLLLLM